MTLDSSCASGSATFLAVNTGIENMGNVLADYVWAHWIMYVPCIYNPFNHSCLIVTQLSLNNNVLIQLIYSTWQLKSCRHLFIEPPKRSISQKITIQMHGRPSRTAYYSPRYQRHYWTCRRLTSRSFMISILKSCALHCGEYCVTRNFRLIIFIDPNHPKGTPVSGRSVASIHILKGVAFMYPLPPSLAITM